MNRANKYLALLLLTTFAAACSQAKPKATTGPEKPGCFFDGDVSDSVKVTSEAIGDTQVLNLSWEATTTPGATWVPPQRIATADLGSGIECSAPFDLFPPGDIAVEVTGERLLQLTIPKASAVSLADRCSSGKLEIMVNVNPGGYAEPCTDLGSGGLPFYTIAIAVSVSPTGDLEVGAITAGKGLEG
tara:strand:+ start:272 stop:832 length:561 start_codon:yes stop_codon:yes gene_type:complete